MVLQAQIRVATEFAFLDFLACKPGVLVIQLIAQAIQQRIDVVVHEASLAEAERWVIDQLLADTRRQLWQALIQSQQVVEPVWGRAQCIV